MKEKVKNKIINKNKALNIYKERKYIDISNDKDNLKKNNNQEEKEDSTFLDVFKNIGKIIGTIVFSPILVIAYPIYLAIHNEDKEKIDKEQEKFKPVDNVRYIDQYGDIVNWKIKRRDKTTIVNLRTNKNEKIKRTYNKTLDNLHRKKIIKPYSKISLIDSKKLKNIKK